MTTRLEHFALEQVADGVWAATAIPGRRAAANAAIVDLGGEALVFDTTATPSTARDLRAAAEDLCGPVRSVVLSHWHLDHVVGAVAMPADATVVTTAETRRLMETQTAERLRDLEGEFAGLGVRLADETFERQRDLRGSQRTVKLYCYGGGHTASDAFALVPDAGVLLAGDLVLVRKHVWAGDGDPDAWREILERALQLEFDRVVGGHGDIGGLADVEAMRAYLHDLSLAAERGVYAERPARYADWDWPDGWRANLRALVEHDVARIDGLPA